MVALYSVIAPKLCVGSGFIFLVVVVVFFFWSMNEVIWVSCISHSCGEWMLHYNTRCFDLGLFLSSSDMW